MLFSDKQYVLAISVDRSVTANAQVRAALERDNGNY
jgi:hypothetical protein